MAAAVTDRQTGGLTLISPSGQIFHTQTHKSSTTWKGKNKAHDPKQRSADARLTACLVFNQSRRDSHPTSLRYEKMSSGELLDTPWVTLVTLIGTPETLKKYGILKNKRENTLILKE